MKAIHIFINELGNLTLNNRSGSKYRIGSLVRNDSTESETTSNHNVLVPAGFCQHRPNATAVGEGRSVLYRALRTSRDKGFLL